MSLCSNSTRCLNIQCFGRWYFTKDMIPSLLGLQSVLYTMQHKMLKTSITQHNFLHLIIMYPREQLLANQLKPRINNNHTASENKLHTAYIWKSALLLNGLLGQYYLIGQKPSSSPETLSMAINHQYMTTLSDDL